MKKSILLRLIPLLAGVLSWTDATASINGHKVEVQDAAAAKAVIMQGGHLIADYGAFQLYDIPQITGNLPGSAQIRDDYNSILLNAAHLDTSKAETQALRKTVGAFNGKQMHLVQFAGPVQPAWRQALSDLGAEIVTYIPQNTYLVYGDAATIGRVQAMAAAAPHIQWEGAYLNDYKVHPLARAVDKNGKPRDIGTDRFAIQLLADAAANADTLKLIDQLKLEPVRRLHPVLNFVDMVVRLSPSDLPKIAARPDVVSIQRYSLPKKVCERQDQIVAGNLSGNTPTGPGYLAWLESRGFTQAQFTASGFVVDVSDSGIDNGTENPNHFGLYVTGNVNDPSRVVYNILQGTPNRGSTLEGCDGHGNINAHIVMGYDDGTGFPYADGSGFHYGLGVCPFVYVGSSVIFDPIDSTSPDDSAVLSTAYQHGARISNNSWADANAGDDGTYNQDSQEYDKLVRDAEPAVAGNQEMVVVFAAGNDGPSAFSVSPPSTAKNVIAVGAADNVQPFGGEDSSGVGDSDADNANNIISFSGRGPCNDGRIKPDLVAPGTHVSGGAPQNPHPGSDGAALSCFLDFVAEYGADNFGVSGGVGTNGVNQGVNPFFPNGQQFYTASSGTSHSTPCVTGGCALVRQYFINQSFSPPSPAMTKAFLMNSARYMTGDGANDTLWSDSQGMGEMDLGMAFDGTPRILRDELSGDMFTATGQKRVFTGVVGDSTKPFRVTLAWTDAPGSTAAQAAYNNDLDLTVTIGGKTYLGNNFSGANSVTGGSADTVDNVESVFLPAGVSGEFTVTVTAANINSIGVPNSTDALTQDFALVVYNAGAAPITLTSCTLTTSEPCANGVVNPGETVTVNMVLQNTGTVPTTNLVASLLPYLIYRDEIVPGSNAPADELAQVLATNQTAFPSGPQTYGALPIGASATNQFSFYADGTCGQTITAIFQLQDGPLVLGSVSTNFQLGCSGCPSTNGSITNIVFPTNGYDLVTFFPIVVVTGLAASNSNVVLYDNGISNMTIPVDGTGVYAAVDTFRFGSNALSVTPEATVNVFITPAAPVLQVPSVVNTNVFVSGFGAPGATVHFYVSPTGPALPQTLLVDAFGDYFGTIILPLGSNNLTATESIDGQTSTNSISNPVNVVPVPPPVIISPFDGATVNKQAQTVSGKGQAGATVTIYDIASGVTNVLAATTVRRSGTYSVVVKLADGINTLFAVQEQNAINSPSSGSVVVGDYYLGPVFLSQPQNQTNFLKGSVTFSAQVIGAAPLRLSWWKNGVKIPGATGEKLTLSNLQFAETNNTYLLVASNANNVAQSSSVKVFIVSNPFANLTGTYRGLFFPADASVEFQSSGLLTLNLTSLGKFTARILNAGSGYSFSGGLSGVGWWSNTVSRGAAETPLSVVLDLNVTNGSNQITGSVSDGISWTAYLEADRALYGHANPSPIQGKFTMLFGDTNNGAGYATVNVNPAGLVSLSGVLSDNTSIALGAVSVSTTGRWPLYIPLYGRVGSLMSWIYFTNEGVSIVDLATSNGCSFVGSNALWVRINSDGKYYPGGFTNAPIILGSAFSPGNDAALIDMTNLEVIIAGGALPGIFTNNVSPSPNGKLTINGSGIPGLALSLNPATGLIRGSFTDPVTSATALIKGILFQDQTNAGGFFLTRTNAGNFLLTPP